MRITFKKTTSTPLADFGKLLTDKIADMGSGLEYKELSETTDSEGERVYHLDVATNRRTFTEDKLEDLAGLLRKLDGITLVSFQKHPSAEAEPYGSDGRLAPPELTASFNLGF